MELNKSLEIIHLPAKRTPTLPKFLDKFVEQIDLKKAISIWLCELIGKVQKSTFQTEMIYVLDKSISWKKALTF